MVNKSLPTMGCAGNVKLLCYSTFRKAMRYRLEVRNSREVKFALEVFSSLNSNNFVRFFKLLKSASYLNACIIHRYFTQVRRSALRVMTRAYTPNSPYPLRVLQDLLAFEDKHEVRMTFFFIILSAILGSRVKSYIRVPVNSKERDSRSELNVHCMCWAAKSCNLQPFFIHMLLYLQTDPATNWKSEVPL